MTVYYQFSLFRTTLLFVIAQIEKNSSNFLECSQALKFQAFFLVIKLFLLFMNIFMGGCFHMNFQNRFGIRLEGTWRISVFINLKKLTLANMFCLKFLPKPLGQVMFSLAKSIFKIYKMRIFVESDLMSVFTHLNPLEQ